MVSELHQQYDDVFFRQHCFVEKCENKWIDEEYRYEKKNLFFVCVVGWFLKSKYILTPIKSLSPNNTSYYGSLVISAWSIGLFPFTIHWSAHVGLKYWK